MNPRAGAMLLVLLPLTMGAGRITTQVTLDRNGGGKVLMTIETGPGGMVVHDGAKLTPSHIMPALRADQLLSRILRASPAELRQILTAQGYSSINVTQSLKKNVQKTEVRAVLRDVRALCALGGQLTFTETPGNFLELDGTIGGALADEKRDDALFEPVKLALTLKFPGTVSREKTDKSAVVSHSGRAVTYRWTGSQLLTSATKVHVLVVPDIQGSPYFWLALILGITGLVVLGAFVVLRYGREALKPRPDK